MPRGPMFSTGRYQALLAVYSEAIWARFDAAAADPRESVVVVTERASDVDIRIEKRATLAAALRDINPKAASEIEGAVLPSGEIMVMVMPLSNEGALVAPLGRGGRSLLRGEA